MTPEQLLEDVSDWHSFAVFVEALAEERVKVEKMELETPGYNRYGGALGWQNARISTFLEAALMCVEGNSRREPIPETPSWQFLAEFLYGGKIYE